MSAEYVSYLYSEFRITMSDVFSICENPEQVHLALTPLEVNAKDIDYSVQINFLMPMDL